MFLAILSADDTAGDTDSGSSARQHRSKRALNSVPPQNFRE